MLVQRSRLLILASALAGIVVLAPAVAAATDGASPPVEAAIPLTPLAGLTSLEATAHITVDGTVDGKPTQGDLTARLTTNAQGSSQIVVTGSLLGDVVAKVGGKAVSLFRPKELSVYAVPEGTYVVLGGFFDVCIEPGDSQATAALDQLSPQGLMTLLTSSDVARGTFVADEIMGTMPVKHYRINGEAFMAAAQASTDPTVSTFAWSLRSAADADLYVDTDGGYPVAYHGSFSGTFEPLQFDGDLTVEIALTGINENTEVTVPGACDHPVSA